MTPQEAVRTYQEAEAEWWALKSKTTLTLEEQEREVYLWEFMTTFPCPVWTPPYPEVLGRIYDELESGTVVEN